MFVLVKSTWGCFITATTQVSSQCIFTFTVKATRASVIFCIPHSRSAQDHRPDATLFSNGVRFHSITLALAAILESTQHTQSRLLRGKWYVLTSQTSYVIPLLIFSTLVNVVDAPVLDGFQVLGIKHLENVFCPVPFLALRRLRRTSLIPVVVLSSL